MTNRIIPTAKRLRPVDEYDLDLYQGTEAALIASIVGGPLAEVARGPLEYRDVLGFSVAGTPVENGHRIRLYGSGSPRSRKVEFSESFKATGLLSPQAPRVDSED